MKKLKNNAYYDAELGVTVFMRNSIYYVLYKSQEIKFDAAHSIEDALALFKQSLALFDLLSFLTKK
jgi:hypothetical protein